MGSSYVFISYGIWLWLHGHVVQAGSGGEEKRDQHYKYVII